MVQSILFLRINKLSCKYLRVKMLEVSSIVSTTAVGSLNTEYKPGELVLIDQFLDMTKSRNGTFFDGEFRGVAHIDMTNPYCQTLRNVIIQAGMKMKLLSILMVHIYVRKDHDLRLRRK